MRKYLLQFRLLICQFSKPKLLFAIPELSPNVFSSILKILRYLIGPWG